ncbi:DUF2059 domain-containing protein [Caulobacter sp. S45]|uniref:DUF2059 domain-containing protein n=1 Tax=Caulobacter sp. S45 TaxID=1641861 RepID=UPI00131E969C|nr:DUF2059 domain-containing protein [Caulobacter sp. S45]
MKPLTMTLAAVAAISTASAGWADTTPPPPRSNTLKLAALVAAAPTPEKLALAHQMMVAIGFQDQIQTVLANVNGMMAKIASPSASPEQHHMMELVQQDAQQELFKLLPEMETAATRIYANNLTDKEMTDFIAWQNSESGRSIRSKTAVMSRQMSTAITPMLINMMPTVVRRAMDRVCEQNQCTPEQRQQMNAAVAKAMG